MAFRPRRVAAQKANTAITDMVDSDNAVSARRDSIAMSSRQSRRSDARSPPQKPRASAGRSSGISSRSTIARENFVGGEIMQGKRNRSQKKSYRVDSSDDEDAAGEDDVDAEGEEDDDMVDASEIVVDADMDVDAEGEEDDMDAEGEDDMDVDPTPPSRNTAKVPRPAPARNSITSKPKSAPRSATKAAPQQEDSDDEELSELESEADEIQDTVNVGGGGGGGGGEDDEDDEEEEEEEEEEDEMEGNGAAEEEEEEDEEGQELDSDDEGSDEGSPDLDKMTKRQRARFVDDDGALMKLSDEVQAKKVFTAEELSMRRAEMARRRRNLSEKRNEEVKMETIHKLLHKQAPKTNRKAQAAEEEAAQEERANPVFVRWVNNKAGSIVAVPDEMLEAPPGRVFVPRGLASGKMVEEVS